MTSAIAAAARSKLCWTLLLVQPLQNSQTKNQVHSVNHFKIKLLWKNSRTELHWQYWQLWNVHKSEEPTGLERICSILHETRCVLYGSAARHELLVWLDKVWLELLHYIFFIIIESYHIRLFYYVIYIDFIDFWLHGHRMASRSG